jgi:hypothetical protein
VNESEKQIPAVIIQKNLKEKISINRKKAQKAGVQYNAVQNTYESEAPTLAFSKPRFFRRSTSS